MSGIQKTIILFGSMSIIILLLFQLEKWSLYTIRDSETLTLIISGILFLILGMVTSRYFFLKSEQKKRITVKSSLSEQELTVLNLVAEGKSNKEIANQLFIAETTVKSHVSNILSKLNAKRRTEAIKIGRELRII